MSQTEDCSPRDSLSDSCEELFQRTMAFRIVLYLVRAKNIKQVRDTFIKGFKNKQTKKQIRIYTVNHYGLGTWEGSLIIEGVPT